jgi:hypothetical protein
MTPSKIRPGVVDYHDFTTKDMPVAERRQLGVGDLWINAAQCLKCGDTVRSQNRHDFVSCSCGALSVDGGSWYARRSFSGSPEDYRDLSEPFDDVEDDDGSQGTS